MQTAAYENVVIGNRIIGNGQPGVAMHTPGLRRLLHLGFDSRALGANNDPLAATIREVLAQISRSVIYPGASNRCA